MSSTATAQTSECFSTLPGGIGSSHRLDLDTLRALSGASADKHAPAPSPIELRELSEGRTGEPVEEAEKWNGSRTTMFRVLATFWSFFIMGLSDAAYGAIIPSLEEYYDLSYQTVALVFLSPFVGYILSAVSNQFLHMTVGQRGIAITISCCHLIAHITACLHPPYPVLVVMLVFAGFGNGLSDAAWNPWMSSLANSSELLGLMHGFYGLGGVISPFIATAMITKAHLPWFTFYYVMTAAAVVECGVLVAPFWAATAQAFRRAHSREVSATADLRTALTRAPWARVSWLCAAFVLCYMGLEVALGGWVVTFMMTVRNAGAFESGMTATGFWLGLTAGRIILGFVTPRIGTRRAIMIYLPLAMALELLFWLVPQFYVSAVAVAVEGFFLGPMFPAFVVAVTDLLPPHLHVATIGFVAAFGGSGAAVLPFAVGALAQSHGVQVLQPIILTLLGVLLVTWLALPRKTAKQE
ncbi:MFS general substrate transporter [Thozetella sp. PMI_491]|nr:MFS general substrate transporter [Thozetella sp. PMI_491]